MDHTLAVRRFEPARDLRENLEPVRKPEPAAQQSTAQALALQPLNDEIRATIEAIRQS